MKKLFNGLCIVVLSGCASLKLINGESSPVSSVQSKIVKSEGFAFRGVTIAGQEVAVDLDTLCSPGQTWHFVRVRENLYSLLPFVKESKSVDYSCKGSR